MKFFVVDLYSNGTIKTEHCDTHYSQQYMKFVNRYDMTHNIIVKLTSGEVVHIEELTDECGDVFNRTFIAMPQGSNK